MQTITMPQMRQTEPVSRRERSDENLKFANDGSLASVDRMLRKLSIKCYSRVQAMGLGMDFDDVLQEMYLSYVKAKEKWNPQGGALFSTYCNTVCLNNFNHAIKKMERERAELGMVSDSMFEGEDGLVGVSEIIPGPESDHPEARLSGAQQTRLKLASLSHSAKLLVSLLLQAEQNKNIEPSPKLRDLARMAQLEGAELKRVKIEILNTFGVRW